jgi:hypothetical protein
MTDTEVTIEIKKKRSAEEVGKDTGEAVGQSLKKGWGAAKAFGKGLKEEVKKKT